MTEVNKPTLLLDASKARNNIARMKARADLHGARFRPHFKTHQSAVVGEWFRAQGVRAITVSSVDMAIYFANHGWDDITIAFPLNIREMERINRLAARVRLTVIVDNASQIRALAEHLKQPLNVMIELDTGHGRSGVDADDVAKITGLADMLDQNANLRFTGLLTHAGHTYVARGYAEVEAIAQNACMKMDALRQSLGRPGLLLSWGDTPSCSMLETLPPFDEWRPGNFVFYDLMQYHIGACKLDQIAVALLCPVVGVYPERSQMIVHAGAVHLSKDFIAADNDFRNYGYLVKLHDGGWSDPFPGAWVSSLSQEHGIVQFLPGTGIPFQPGDLVGILPVHSCLTADAMGEYLTLDGQRLPMMPKSVF